MRSIREYCSKMVHFNDDIQQHPLDNPQLNTLLTTESSSNSDYSRLILRLAINISFKKLYVIWNVNFVPVAYFTHKFLECKICSFQFPSHRTVIDENSFVFIWKCLLHLCIAFEHLNIALHLNVPIISSYCTTNLKDNQNNRLTFINNKPMRFTSNALQILLTPNWEKFISIDCYIDNQTFLIVIIIFFLNSIDCFFKYTKIPEIPEIRERISFQMVPLA